jgi:Tat protein translocase TatB subunit
LHALLILETIGTTELMLILVVALILLGPRKLPDLARSLGKGLNEFKRASDDFKRTWEREVELERVETRERIDRAMIDAPEPAAPTGAADEHSIAPPVFALPPREGEIVARGAAATAAAETESVPANAPDAVDAAARKSDWL